MADRPLTVLQVSDSHLFADRHGVLKGVATYDSLRRVLSDARRRHPEADAYLLSGDLSQDGSGDSYAHLSGLLDVVPAPVFPIPGNHDDPVRMRTGLRSSVVRHQAWVDMGPWRLAFLSSHVAGEEYGFIAAEEEGRLAACAREAPAHLLVCVHHPPVALGSPWLDASRLRNARALFDAMRPAGGSRVVLCGHAHQAYERREDGVALLGAPSTCVQFKPRTPRFEPDDLPPGYRVVRLHADGGVDTAVVRVA